jgi:fatty-acid desaturase
MFTHRHYFFIVFLFIFILSLINFKFLVFFYSIPILCSYLLTGLVNSVGHTCGYRNFNTPDNSYNNILIHILSFGGGMHNNHHAFPNKYDYSALRWFEIDPAAILIKYVFEKK